MLVWTRATRPRVFTSLVHHQHAARSVALLRNFVESHHDCLAASAGFFHHGVGDALRQLALLIGGAAGQHCDLD